MKTVVITGATRGIGYALTQKFLKGGYNVVGFYHSSDEIANSLNFYDTAYFIKVFQEHTGMTPRQYIKNRKL